MFSTGEYQYIRDLTINYYNNDYHYYSCITNNPIGLNNTNNIVDISCYYSKSKDLKNGVRCDFDSNNYSTNNTIDKLTCSNYSNLPQFSKKEFVYSNVQLNSADIIGDYRLNNDYSIISLCVLIILIVCLLYQFIRSIF